MMSWRSLLIDGSLRHPRSCYAQVSLIVMLLLLWPVRYFYELRRHMKHAVGFSVLRIQPRLCKHKGRWRRNDRQKERSGIREREMSTGNKSIYEMLSKSFCYMEQFITPIAWLSESFVPACLAWKVPHYLCYGKLKRNLVFHPLG